MDFNKEKYQYSDEEEAYNITVINERFANKYKKKHPNYCNIEFNGVKFQEITIGIYPNHRKSIDFTNVIRKYDDYYFIFVDMSDNSAQNTLFLYKLYVF